VIPILIVAGVVFGRWWRFTLTAAMFGWPLALVIADVMQLEWGLFSAAALAVVNTLVGVLVHQVIAWGIRRLRQHHRAVADR
jgi:uncharacterized membrane protein